VSSYYTDEAEKEEASKPPAKKPRGSSGKGGVGAQRKRAAPDVGM